MSDMALRAPLRARRTQAVAVDWTKCFDYERLLEEELAVYSTLEVTQDLKEGGIATNFAWEGWYRFLASRWGTDFGTEVVRAARHFESPRLLSLGCGHGGFELGVARQLPRGRMLALDVNEGLFGAARERVASQGLDVTFQAIDLNFVELEPNSFDVVFAHASLHHLLNFEHLMAQVYDALGPDGRLVLLDIIGKTQAIFWPENVRFATELVAAMPERLRGGVRVEPRALFPGYVDGAEQSGMEGIRQEELEDQLLRWFRPLQCFKYNSFVRLICTQPELVRRFDADHPEDRAYLDRLYRLDLEQIESGALRPTEMFAVYEKRPPADVPIVAREASGPGRPAVSVLLACDGTAEQLRTSVASLVAQTHAPAEILLLPSSQAGGVAEAAGKLAAEHLRARVVERSAVMAADGTVDWGGLSTSATGELIAHLSGRDTWVPIMLGELARGLATSPGAGMAYCQALVVDDRGRRRTRANGRDALGEAPPDHGARAAPPPLVPRSTAIFRRSALRSLSWTEGGPGPWPTFHEPRPVVFVERPMAMLRAGASAEDDRGLLLEPPLSAGAPCSPPPARPPSALSRLMHWVRG